VKIIYTYYVKDNNFACGFQNEQVMLYCFKLSIESVKKHLKGVTEIEVNTNVDFLDDKDLGIAILKPEFPDFNHNWWNFPKIFTYSLQKTPFLHVDFDLIFTKDIDLREYTQKPLICEAIRGLSFMKHEIAHIVDTNHYFPYIPCSGIYGGYYLDLFKELYEKAVKIQSLIDKPTYEDLFILEEVFMACVMKRENIKPISLEGNFVHLQGARKKQILEKEDILKLLK
jgi:hypothetical protein